MPWKRLARNRIENIVSLIFQEKGLMDGFNYFDDLLDENKKTTFQIQVFLFIMFFFL